MDLGFRFVPSLDGSLEGINDAGIETFAGHRVASLAREQAQNSLDAKNPGAKGPVVVEYKLEFINRTDFPGADALAQAIEASIKYWSDKAREHKKTLSILQKAKRAIARDKVNFLRISDRNTTGLLASDKVEQGDWFSLTKASGVSLKGDDALGSYGIGKNVFWLNSALRTVFFSTRDLGGRRAFQGVTKLVSHPLSKTEGGERGLSRSVGFYGITDGFRPIRAAGDIPEYFRTKDIGTEIFVSAFEMSDDWEGNLIAAFARNFFAAFQEDLLVVRIRDHELSKATIQPIIAGLHSRDPGGFRDLQDYFDCLTSADARVFEETLPHIGKARVRLLLREGAKKRIAMFRATGMMIFELGHFRTPLEFAGVCTCDDPEGNKFLRRLEPPNHDQWEPERNEEDQAAARQAISALKNWLRKCVQDLYPEADTTSLEIPDLEKYLPDDEEEEPLDHPPSEAEGDPVPKEERVLEGKTRPPRKLGAGEEQAGDAIAEEEGEAGGTSSNEADGGDRGSKGGPGPSEVEVDVPLRVFKDPADASRYLVRGELPADGKYAIYMYAFGDDGRRDPVEISTPRSQEQSSERATLLKRGSNGIGPFSGKRKAAVQIEFTIDTKLPLTLSTRVTRYAD